MTTTDDIDVTGGEVTPEHARLLEWVRRGNVGAQIAASLTGRRRKPRPEFYRSPIDLVPGASGPISVCHRTVTGTTPIIGARQAMLRGCRPVMAELAAPLRVHELREDGRGVWMTDLPEELNQIGEALDTVRPAGSVLVGGLGLGILAATLAARPFVDRVVVVEQSADVIALCAADGYEVVHGDIGEYLRTCPEPFDFWMLDTWQGTGEATWWSEVMPLRRTIANRFGKQRVHCWAEDIMLGQVVPAAARGAGQHWFYRALPEDPAPDILRRFFRDVGMPAWERQHGAAVDAITREEG